MLMEKIKMQANQINKKIVVFLTSSVIIFALTGCKSPYSDLLPDPKPDPVRQQQQNKSMAKRFQQSAPIGRSTIDSTIELLKKHSDLTEQMVLLRKKNEMLTDSNNQLKEQLATLKPELAQTKKELTQANELLIEMRIELNNWKTNILGFRDEMRDTEKAQFEALLKILEVLGGEIETDQLTTETSTASPNEPAKTQSDEILISGKP